MIDSTLHSRRLSRPSLAFARLEAQLARLVAAPAAPVVVTGPVGCGKRSALARLHRRSTAQAGQVAPWVELHCGAFSPEALQLELFGDSASGSGALERAAGGTLLLREVGAVPQGIQAQLAQTLENQLFWRRPRGQAVRLRARVVASSRSELTPQVEEGSLLPELYEQLSVFTVAAPPLADCREDIVPLANFFLAESVVGHGRALTLAPEAAQVLSAYTFPGNVRELRTIICRAALFAEGDQVRGSDIVLSQPASQSARDAFFAVELGRSAIPLPLEQVSRRYVARVLAHYREHRTAAAEALGISYPTFLKRLRELGIDEEAS